MRLAVLPALSLIACAAANQASGTVLERGWSAPLVRGVYCEYCGGGPRVTLTFGEPTGWNLTVETDSCSDGATAYVGDGGGARITLLNRDHDESASDGEVVLDACTPDAARGTFSARFANGDEVSGRFSTRLEFDHGFE